MDKLFICIMGAVAILLVSGCASDGGAGKDVVGDWQKNRSPVEVVQPTSENAATRSAIIALAPISSGLYKTVAMYVDKAGAIDRGRRTYIGYVNDVKAKEANGIAHDQACKEVKDAVLKMENGAETWKVVADYSAAVKTTNFDVINATIIDLQKNLQDATAKIAQETQVLLQKLANDPELQSNPFALAGQSKKLKDDLGKITDQLADAGNGLKIYINLMNEDQAAVKYLADYPVEN